MSVRSVICAASAAAGLASAASAASAAVSVSAYVAGGVVNDIEANSGTTFFSNV